MPTRLQRKRSAGYRMPEGAVYVGPQDNMEGPVVLHYVEADVPLPEAAVVEGQVTD